MRTARRLLPLFVFLSSLSLPLWPLDVSQGRMKLALHEGIGRFSLSYLSDTKTNTYTPLFFANDPRTSVVSLAIGNKVYRLGESSEFKEAVEKTQAGAKFVWTAPFLSVTEEFTFISSKEGGLADGVRIDLVLKNLSEQDESVGVRYIFDTYLGEASYVHFRTDKIPEITRELTLTKADRTQYWVSPLVGDPEQLGLICMLSGEGISTPDKVVFANWKRLNDATWDYETSSSRSFNLPPYSINDSAVSHYFNPQIIPKGSEWRIVTVMGRYNAAGFSLAPERAANISETLKEVVTASKDINDLTLAAQTDLASVDKLLQAIDLALASGTPPTESDLSSLAQVLAELGDRSAKFQKGTGK